MTKLHDALDELAAQAPRPDLTSHVLRRAGRRRRVRMVGMVSVPAALGVAGVLALTSLLQGGTERAPNLVGPREKALNDGPLPGPLPAKGAEPVRGAYLDWCRKTPAEQATVPSQDCAQWRVVSKSGRQWRVADSLGVHSHGSAPFQISDNGRRIAYFRAADERFVVRDLASGSVVVVSARVPAKDLVMSGATLMFSGDGRWLALQYGSEERFRLADTNKGHIRFLPAGHVLGLGQDASTVTLAEVGRDDNWETLVLSGRDGQVRGRVPLDPNVHVPDGGNLTSPDGLTLITRPGREPRDEDNPNPLESVALVDVRTGKVTGIHRLHIPKEQRNFAAPMGWVDRSTIVIGFSWPSEPMVGPSGKLLIVGDGIAQANLGTGRFREVWTLKLEGANTETTTGGYGR